MVINNLAGDAMRNIEEIFSTEIKDKKLKSLFDFAESAYICSHDMRSYLRSINNFLYLAKDNYNKDYINGAIMAVTQLNNLVNFLLSDRYENNLMDLHDTLLQDIINEVIDSLKAIMPFNQVEFVIEKVPEIKLSKVLITQLLRNLIINSFNFRNNRRFIIHIGFLEKKDCWVFFVEDNGKGIDKSIIGRIFDLGFYNSKVLESGEKSFGMGLYICKKIVQLYKGEIWADSPGPGLGSTIFFTIPK